MSALETKIPPPIVLLLVGYVMWLSAVYFPIVELNATVRWVLIALFLIGGLFIALLAVVEFIKLRTTVNPMRPDKTSTLITGGIYQLTRNPIYLGDVCLLIAWSFYLSSFFMLMGVVGFVLYINRFQILAEEKMLTKKFGLAYANYQTKVRRWL